VSGQKSPVTGMAHFFSAPFTVPFTFTIASYQQISKSQGLKTFFLNHFFHGKQKNAKNS
jgi:hypothetical protein